MKKVLPILVALMALTISTRAEETPQESAMDNLKCGDVVTLTPQAEPGYEFERWDDKDASGEYIKDNPRTIEISADTKLWEYVAVFKKVDVPMSITANDPEMGKVTITGTCQVGEEITMTADSISPCYRFSHWQDDETNTNPVRKVVLGATMEENTYVAVFVERTFKVSVKSMNGSIKIAKVEK